VITGGGLDIEAAAHGAGDDRVAEFQVEDRGGSTRGCR
jgi:hypothetical protein